MPRHHLYVLSVGADELRRRHLRFRDHLRRFPAHAEAYARLKAELARTVGHNRTAYTEGKTAFVQGILALGHPPE